MNRVPIITLILLLLGGLLLFNSSPTTYADALPAISLTAQPIHGRLTQPVAQASVQLRDTTGKVVSTTFVDAQGYFRLPPVAAASYTLVAVSADGSPLTAPVITDPSIPDLAYTLSVGSEMAQEPFSVTGRIAPIVPNALVQLVGDFGEIAGETRVSLDGQFRFLNVPVGAYTMRVLDREKRALTLLEEATVSADSTLTLTLADDDALMQAIEANFHHSSAAARTNTTLTVQARTADTNQPLTNAYVTLYLASCHCYYDYGYTDGSGNVMFNVAADGYKISIDLDYDDRAYLDEWYDGGTNHSNATAIQVVDGTNQTVTATLERGGEIAGRVTADETGAPITNASVTLYRDGQSFVDSVNVDGNGDYQIVGLAHGTYYLQVEPNGLGNYLAEYYNNQTTYENATPIVVGATPASADVSLATGGIISGRVTESLTGFPLEDVSVTAYNEHWGFEESIRTDSNGNYQLTRFESDTYYLFFDPPYDSDHLATYYDGARFQAGATPISPVAGETTTINQALLISGSLSGRVSYADTGSAVPSGTTVFLFNTIGDYVANTSTNSAGEYTFTGLYPDNYHVYVEKPFNSAYLGEYYNDKVDMASADPVTVIDAQQTSNIDIALDRGATIAGTVTSAATGTPVQFVRVTLYEETSGDQIITQDTDANGRYEIEGLPTGFVIVEFSAFSGGFQSEYYDGASDAQSAESVSLIAGTTTDNIDATLNQSGQIRGVVTAGDSGNPLSDVYIKSVDANGSFLNSTYTGFDGSYTLFGHSDEAQHLIFERPYLSQYASEYYSDAYTLAAATPLSVSLNQVVTADVALEIGGSISGKISGSDSGQGIPFATVYPYNDHYPYFDSVTTDNNGDYLLQGLPPVGFSLRFEATNYAREFYDDQPDLDSADKVTAPLGTTVNNVDALLDRYALITGVVTAEDTGQPLSNIAVYLYREGDLHGYRYSAQTDFSGQYTFVGVEAGTYRIQFAAFNQPDYLDEYYDNATSQTATPVTIAHNQNYQFDAELAFGGQITGVVTDEVSGNPLSFIAVRAYNLDTFRAESAAYTDSNGRYTVSGLETGNYRLYFDTVNNNENLDEYYDDVTSPSDATPVAVTRGQITANIDAALARGGVIRGVVTTDDTGAPLDNVTVIATDPVSTSSYGNSAHTNANGEYEISGIDPGNYILEFVPSSYNSAYAGEYHPDAPLRSEATPLTVAVNGEYDVDADLSRAATITGSIISQETEAVLRDTDLSVYDGDGRYIKNEYNPNGTFAISGLRATSYYLLAEPTFNDEQHLPIYYMDSHTLEEATPIVLTTGDTVDVTIALPLGGVFNGIVTNTDGQPAADVNVAAYDAVSRSFVRSTQTNGDGSYTLTGLPSSGYYLNFTPTSADQSHAPSFYSHATNIADATPIGIMQGETKTVNYELMAAATIAGVLRSAETDQPMDNVYASLYRLSDVNCYSASEYVTAFYTDENGAFSLSQLLPGTYYLRFEPNSAADWGDYLIEHITLAPIAVGETRTVSATATRGAQVAGQVTAADGGTVASVQISLQNGSDSLYSYTDTSGNYTITGLKAGQYDVLITPSNQTGYLPQQITNGVTLASGQQLSDVDFTLTVGGRISGQISYSSSGATLSNGSIAIYSTADNDYVGYANPDQNGVYVTGGLPAGQYHVEYIPSSNDYTNRNLIREYYGGGYTLTGATAVAVSAENTTENIDIALEMGGTIAGYVFNTENSYVGQRMLVHLLTPDGERLRTTTSDGHTTFAFYGVPDGTYHILFDDFLVGNVEAMCSTVNLNGQYYDNAVSLEEATPVTISGGNTVTEIVGYVSDQNPPYRRANSHAVSGQISEGVNGIADVTVQTDSGATTTTDMSGNYTLYLTTGSHTLTAHHADYAFTPATLNVTVSADATDNNFTAQPLPATASIAGTVAPSRSASDLIITAYKQVGDRWQYVKHTSTSDGNYTLTALTAGAYRIKFSIPNGAFAPVYYGGATLAGATTLTLSDGQQMSGIDGQPTLAAPAAIDVAGGQSVVDPHTGEVSIRAGRESAELTISRTVTCPTTLIRVELLIGDKLFPMTAQGNDVYSVTLTAPDDLGNGEQISVQKTCAAGIDSERVGSLTLYDPSGVITNAQTGQPVEGAQVYLYRVPNALPDANGETRDCRTIETRPATGGGTFGAWSGLTSAEISSGVLVNGDSDQLNGQPIFSPTTNPQVTDTHGRYGWDVAEGCWFVVVEAANYETIVSPVVGVPPAVLDLDIAMTTTVPLAVTQQGQSAHTTTLYLLWVLPLLLGLITLYVRKLDGQIDVDTDKP